MASISAGMVAASCLRLWPISFTEVLGFVTGGVCVWLTVRESVWNWPIGLANNVLFFVLFLWSRVYADMSLQVIYFGLGVYGWLNWIRGGAGQTGLPISRTVRWEWLSLPLFVVLGTAILREVLVAVHGASPFMDALTTIL